MDSLARDNGSDTIASPLTIPVAPSTFLGPGRLPETSLIGRTAPRFGHGRCAVRGCKPALCHPACSQPDSGCYVASAVDKTRIVRVAACTAAVKRRGIGFIERRARAEALYKIRIG